MANITKKYIENGIQYEDIILRGENGKPYANRSVLDSVFHATAGNSKTGTAWNVNFPIYYTCRHDCECYKNGTCYAENGCYLFADNQIQYSENLNFYMNSTDSQWLAAMADLFNSKKSIQLCRFFTCGDVPDIRFIKLAVKLAKQFPTMRIWFYTKKYQIVNKYCDSFGLESIPENLVIIFSHWMNEDGTYFPMPNPYDFPTSEFIPVGHEELAEKVTHLCPCSDPSVIACCADCDHPCYKLQHGQSMGLLEHSTTKSKTRDGFLKKAHDALKKLLKK